MDEIQRENNAETPKMEGGITGKGFVKGDKRINRKGRPKSFDKLRALVQEIAGETVEGEEVTRIQTMIKRMLDSAQPADRATVLAYGWGKPKDETDNLNVDYSSLSEEQLERIANGEDIRTVVTGKSKSRNRTKAT